MQTAMHTFTPIQGFESTDYAYFEGRIVWVGDDAAVRHPRNYWQPWQPPAKIYSAALLQAGARLCVQQMERDSEPKGLLAWLTNRELLFPLNHAKARFDAVRDALQAKQIQAFEQAALHVLGLGHGLTPSGDDFLGGVFFVLAHKPHPKWLLGLPELQANLDMACGASTNPISAELLADNMAGKSYGELHDMLDALESNDSRFIESAVGALLGVGSSSGADLLAGLLLALTMI
jgi:Protein of unknown function (DUF2877)